MISEIKTFREHINETVRWAIAVMTVMIVFAFVTPENAPQFLLIGIIAITLYLAVDTSQHRLSTALHVAAQLNGEDEAPNTIDPPEILGWHRQAQWGDPLPAVSYREVFSQRLRQSYFVLYLVLGGAWLVYLTLYTPGEGWRDAAAIPGVPGNMVVSVFIGFYLLLTILTLWPTERRPTDEQH